MNIFNKSNKNLFGSKPLPPKVITPWLPIVVAFILYILFQLGLIPETQLSAAALSLLIVYVIFSVPLITRNSQDLLDVANKINLIEENMETISGKLEEITLQNDEIFVDLTRIGKEVSVFTDTSEFYRRLSLLVNENSKIDVTYFTPNIPSDFANEYSEKYWDKINTYLKNKSGLILRRIATIGSKEQLEWLDSTLKAVKNSPNYHLKYILKENAFSRLNVNIIDNEHVFLFGPEERSKYTEYIYIHDEETAKSLRNYFDLLWDKSIELSIGGFQRSKSIVELKMIYGLPCGDPGPIGIFDSGIGGLSIVKEIQRELPDEDIIYFADQGNIPYGNKTPEDILKISDGIARFLFEQECKMIVIACNTATSVAKLDLRKYYNSKPIVGVEPGIKPAALKTLKNKIIVLATKITINSDSYNKLIYEFASDKEIISIEIPGLVDVVEKGDFRLDSTNQLIKSHLLPLISNGDIDTVVLGCTHYAFLKNEISEIVGPNIDVVETSDAVVRQVSNILSNNLAKIDNEKSGTLTILTSGSIAKLRKVLSQLSIKPTKIGAVDWRDGKIELPSQT